MTQAEATLTRFTIADCLRHPDPLRRGLEAIMGHLPNVGADAVVRAYDAALFGTLDELRKDHGDRGLLAARMRALRRPLPTRNKRGLTLAEMAALVSVERSTLTALLEHHGYLELVPFGGHQRRRLVTQTAFDAGVGHNAGPSRTRSRNLDGEARAIVFPVFYAKAVPSIMWSLDWAGIQRDAVGVPNKRDRMRWLLSHHSYLPDQALADLAGYSLRGVKKARSLGGDAVGSHRGPFIGSSPALRVAPLYNFQGHFETPVTGSASPLTRQGI